MTTAGIEVLNLADWASRVDDGGQTAKIAEVLSEENEILDDMLWLEGNEATGHTSVQRTGLPDATWRQLNKGVPAGKSLTEKLEDKCGMLEIYSKVDKSLADLNGNVSAFRASEDKAFIAAMSQTMAQSLFYGNSATDKEKIMGLAARYNSLAAANAANILDAGGSGADNTSIWLVCWSEDTAHGFFPKGQISGLQRNDKKQVTLLDDDNNQYEGYQTHYKWDAGLTVRDWRYVVRIANIDVTTLTKDASAGADLIDLMQQAVDLPPSLKGKCAWYCNRTIRSFLRRQIANKSNVNLNIETVAGKRVLAFDEIPVRRVDKIINTEARVV